MPLFATSPQPQRKRGFSLIELLVAIAILGLLAAIALPAYNNYALKSRFTEVMIATAPTKTAIAACAASKDCITNEAIYIPQAALLVPSQSGGVAVLYAYEQAYYAAFGSQGTTSSVQYSQAQTHTNNGDTVSVDPNDPNHGLCIWTNGACYNDPYGNPSLALFNSYYAPNAAILALPAASRFTLPCVGATGCSPSTKYVSSVSYSSTGVITGTATSTFGLRGETVVLTPSYSSGRIDWIRSGSCQTRAGGSLC